MPIELEFTHVELKSALVERKALLVELNNLLIDTFIPPDFLPEPVFVSGIPDCVIRF